MTCPEYTGQARAAITDAARSEPDFAGWLAGVLASAAAMFGSSAALVQGRPGSWETVKVLELVRGTMGYEDEDLARWAPQEEDHGPWRD